MAKTCTHQLLRIKKHPSRGNEDLHQAHHDKLATEETCNTAGALESILRYHRGHSSQDASVVSLLSIELGLHSVHSHNAFRLSGMLYIFGFVTHDEIQGIRCFSPAAAAPVNSLSGGELLWSILFCYFPSYSNCSRQGTHCSHCCHLTYVPQRQWVCRGLWGQGSVSGFLETCLSVSSHNSL